MTINAKLISINVKGHAFHWDKERIMIMKMMKIVCGVSVACVCAGCLVAPFQPPTAIVSSYSAPLSTEGNWKSGAKSGSAEAICVLGIVAVGDCSLNAAIKNGGLKEVHYADYDYCNILGIYQRVTVKATGD